MIKFIDKCLRAIVKIYQILTELRVTMLTADPNRSRPILILASKLS